MFINLTIEETKQAITEYMENRGFKGVKLDDVVVAEHEEGQYDDRETIFDGFKVNVNLEAFPKL